MRKAPMSFEFRRLFAVTYPADSRDATVLNLGHHIPEESAAWAFIRNHLRAVEYVAGRTEPPATAGAAALAPTVSKLLAAEALNDDDREHVRRYAEAVELYSAERVVIECQLDNW